MIMYYTYIDWTDEINPRPFYVGKGSSNRIRVPERNQKHKHVRKSFGFKRQIVFSSEKEIECLEKEIQLISELHTFYLDENSDKEIACNFTLGGDGTSGWSPTPEQRKNISVGIKKAYENDPLYAKKTSERQKKLMSDPSHLEKISQGIKNAFEKMPLEKKMEMRRKTSEKNKGRDLPQVRGSNSYRTTLTEEIVISIRKEFSILVESMSLTKAVKSLCEKYSQKYNAIYKIVRYVTWKHVTINV